MNEISVIEYSEKALKEVCRFDQEKAPGLTSGIKRYYFSQIFQYVWNKLKPEGVIYSRFADPDSYIDVADRLSEFSNNGVAPTIVPGDECVEVKLKNHSWYFRKLCALWDDVNDKVITNVCSVSPFYDSDTGVAVYSGFEKAIVAIDSIVPEIDEEIRKTIERAL